MSDTTRTGSFIGAGGDSGHGTRERVDMAPSFDAVDEARIGITPDPPAWQRRAVLRQRWDDLASFHWRYPADEVAQRLPAGLTVDTFDGDAWVGLIPFHMRAVRLGGGPVMPYLGTFVEINVRTYVVDRFGHRGVWFWSLDVPRSPIVAVARTMFALPYCWGAGGHDVRRDADGEHHRYWIRRRWPRSGAERPSTDIHYTIGDRVDPDDVTDLDHFVTAGGRCSPNGVAGCCVATWITRAGRSTA